MSNIGIVVNVHPGEDTEEVRKKIVDMFSGKRGNVLLDAKHTPRMEIVDIPIRAGQRWSVEGVEMEIVDTIDHRLSDTLDVVFRAPGTKRSTITIERTRLVLTSSYVCGPTERESDQEAAMRLVRLADNDPPSGMHPHVWSALIAWDMEKLTREWRKHGQNGPKPGNVRYYLTHLREVCEEIDRLRKHVR